MPVPYVADRIYPVHGQEFPPEMEAAASKLAEEILKQVMGKPMPHLYEISVALNVRVDKDGSVRATGLIVSNMAVLSPTHYTDEDDLP